MSALRDTLAGRRAVGRLDRWFHRNSSTLGAVMAFAVACLLGLVAAQFGVEG